MSFRVRFSQDRPDIAYVPSQKKTSSIVEDIFALPMPPFHQEKNFGLDIHTAASIGEVNIIKLLLQSGVSVNKANRSGWTPLLYAAYLGHAETCNVLLDNGAQVDARNSLGQTALMLSSACGNLSVVKILLSKGASGRRADKEGRQPLHYAASCCQNVVVDHLLQSPTEFDPNALDSQGMTPVLEACQAAHELTLTSLLEKGGDPFIKNARGEDGEALATEAPRIIHVIKSCKKKDHGQDSRSSPDTLADLMEAMNLGRYFPRFEQEHIDLRLFFSLTDKDLEEMGVAYGPKKRMLAVIDRYRNTGVIQVDMPLPSAPPAYTDLVSDGRVNPTSDTSQGLSKSILESTQLLALEAIEALGQDETSERLRPLLTGIKDGLQQVLARISRV